MKLSSMPKEATEPLKNFHSTDMAAELYRQSRIRTQLKDREAREIQGLHYKKDRSFGVETEKLTVSSKEAAEFLGKSIGTYYTVHTGDLRLLGQAEYNACRRCLRAALTDAMHTLLPGYRMPLPSDQALNDDLYKLDSQGAEAAARTAVSPEWDNNGHSYTDRHPDDTGVSCITEIPPEPLPETEPLEIHSVLVVGLGNPELTPDAFGSLCVRNLNVTRHLLEKDSPLPETLRSSLHALSAFCPMVLGQTGIETLSLVRGAVDAVKPDLVILLDALAASDPSTLAKTVQISTTGIHPGGGIGNKREPLVMETLGVPVLTVGVPTVIAASSMIYKTLDDAGLLPTEDDEADAPFVPLLRQSLQRHAGNFVAPKDADLSIREFARLTALVINETILGEETAAEWFRRA